MEDEKKDCFELDVVEEMVIAAAESALETTRGEEEKEEEAGATDWCDLSRKIRAAMHFASVLGASNGGGVDGHNRYEDQLYAFVDGQSDKAKKSLELMWISPGLSSWDKLMLPEICQEDRRDHEALLRQHFSTYALVIRKQPGFWTCLIRSPAPQDSSRGPRVVCVPRRV